MLCILLGTGLLVTPFPMLALAILVFLAGTEIRARVEDGLLLSRFGERFLEYKNHTAAYIPLLR
jgi:protein-S-isoprenylcysteine O-methyltransferase Ste14